MIHFYKRCVSSLAWQVAHLWVRSGWVSVLFSHKPSLFRTKESPLKLSILNYSLHSISCVFYLICEEKASIWMQVLFISTTDVKYLFLNDCGAFYQGHNFEAINLHFTALFFMVFKCRIIISIMTFVRFFLFTLLSTFNMKILSFHSDSHKSVLLYFDKSQRCQNAQMNVV